MGVSRLTRSSSRASTSTLGNSTRSSTPVRSKQRMTVEDQFKAAAKEAQDKELQLQIQELKRQLSETKDELHKAQDDLTRSNNVLTMTQAALHRKEQEQEQLDIAMSEQLEADLDLSWTTPAVQPPTLLDRLWAGAAATDPGQTISHPANRALPRAAVFLRCQQTHVFSLPGQKTDSPSPSDPSHATAQICGPCPACASPDANADAFSPGGRGRCCPFCVRPMPGLADGSHVCLSADCWLGASVAETGTARALAVWREVWSPRKLGGRYFFCGPRDEVLHLSNHPERFDLSEWKDGLVLDDGKADGDLTMVPI